MGRRATGSWVRALQCMQGVGIKGSCECDVPLVNPLQTFDSVRDSLEALQTGEDAGRELSLGTLGRQVSDAAAGCNPRATACFLRFLRSELPCELRCMLFYSLMNELAGCFAERADGFVAFQSGDPLPCCGSFVRLSGNWMQSPGSLPPRS